MFGFDTTRSYSSLRIRFSVQTAPRAKSLRVHALIDSGDALNSSGKLGINRGIRVPKNGWKSAMAGPRPLIHYPKLTFSRGG